MHNTQDIINYFNKVSDFPKKGIVFYDISPILSNAELMHDMINVLSQEVVKSGANKIACIDARGFILGSAVAYATKLGLVMIRKPGKLPPPTISENYTLEYNSGTLELRHDVLNSGDKVFIIDDVLATGGTVSAAAALIKKCGSSVVGCGFALEIKALNGKDLIKDSHYFTLAQV